MIEIKKASKHDVLTIKNICDDARRFQRYLGFEQWKDGYPSNELIATDIVSGIGHLIIFNDEIIGYCVIDPTGDNEYDLYPGLWLWNGPYAAVHRLALAANARGRGLGRQIISLIENLVLSQGLPCIKIDTGIDNTPMHRLMTATGFSSGGNCHFSWGKRIVYEKSLVN